MPREPKPYVERGWYISRPAGQYLKLCPVEDGMSEARKILRAKVAEMDAEREQMGRLAPKLTVAELFALFLESVEVEGVEDTFLYYQRWCREFVADYGDRPARSISKADASDFKLAMMKKTYVRGNKPPEPYKPKTVNHALIAAKRAFNWGIDTERLPPGRNPFAKIKQLHCEGRKRVATDEEYHALIKHCLDDAYRHVLIAMRHTSSRPQDIYSLTWDMVKWEDRMWVLDKHKGRRTQREKKPRIIGMGAEVEAILRERMAKHGATGYVFLNENGNPWTKDSLGLRMRRLRERANIRPDENGEEFVLYTNRHTFLTKAGADPTISEATLTRVAGHSDPRTTAKYVHAAKLAIAAAGRQVADGITPSASGSTG